MIILNFLFCKAYFITKHSIINVIDLVYVCLGMCKKANIRCVHSQVVKDYVGYVESKNEHFENSFFETRLSL